MTVIDRGILSVTADVSGLEAEMLKAKRSLRDFGQGTQKDAERAARSIDRYVEGLRTQAVTFGKTSRESELFRLKLRGASDEQLKAADAALRLTERQEKLAGVTKKLGGIAATAGKAIGLALVAAAVGAVAAIDNLIASGAKFQDLAEKMGDSASNVASLAPSARVAGIEMNALADASLHLNKSLNGTDEESKKAQHALAALGLKLDDIRKLSPSDRLETIGRALNEFADGPAKALIATDLFNKSGKEMLVVLKELGQEGSRSRILSDEQIKALDDFADHSARVREELKLTFIGVVADALPIFQEFTRTIADFVKSDTGAGGLVDAFKGIGSIIATVVLNQMKGVAVAAATVGHVFTKLRLAIVGVNLALERLGKGDIAGFNRISAQMSADIEKSEVEYRAFVRRISDIGKTVENPSDPSFDRKEAKNLASRTAKPTLSYRSYDASGKSKADAERNAALKLEIARIKEEADATAAAFDSAEKIIEARRAASLIDEREYYEAKAGLLRLGAQASEFALQAEIDALVRFGKANKLEKKDRLENEKAIADAQGRLSKLQAKNATEQVVAAIQTEAALKRIEDAYRDAGIAARDYLAQIARRSRVEVEGIGKGDAFRQQASDLLSIQERFESERARLEKNRRDSGDTPQAEQDFRRYLALAQDTYNKEVALYYDRTAKIQAKQADWVNGFTEAVHNYIDKSRDMAGQTAQLFDRTFSSLEDAIAEFATTGRADVKGLLNGIASDISKIGARQLLANALTGLQSSDAFGGFFKQALGEVAGTSSGAGLAAAGATVAAELTTAGATLTAELTTAGTTMSAEVLTAGATFAAEVTAAGAGFAASVAAASAASAAGNLGGDALEMALAVAGVGKAVGGPVSAGGLYPVNERGPELLSVAGKQYLMVGAQGGEVTPVRGGDAGMSAPTVNVYVTPPPGSSRQTAMQWGAEAGRHIQNSMRRNGIK